MPEQTGAPAALAPYRAQKTAMLVAQRIVADIDRLGLGLGDRLPPERDMLVDYGVGRGTLRESLRYLEFQGVLSIKAGPRGGPVVGKPDATNLAVTLALLMQLSQGTFRAIAEARQALEPIMAHNAAERISSDHLADLRQTLTAMEGSLEQLGLFLEANKRFHEIIARASANPLFHFLVEAISWIMDGTALGIDYPSHRMEAILEAHRRIYDAIAGGRAAEAERAMRRHISEYVVYIERKFPDAFGQPVTWESLSRA